MLTVTNCETDPNRLDLTIHSTQTEISAFTLNLTSVIHSCST